MSDFDFPPRSNPEVKTSKKSPSSARPSATPTVSAAAAATTQEEAPQEASAEKASDSKYSEEELMVIFDELMFTGEYAEDILIRGKLPVTLRTRTAGEVRKITMELDKDSGNSTLLATINERRSLLTLRYALSSYGSTDLSGMNAEDKEGFISKLPAPVIGALMVELAKFDSKVYEACKAGEGNF
jgi:hypothetical protein